MAVVVIKILKGVEYMTIESGGTSTYISQAISGVDFAQILNEIVSVAPVVLPTIVTIMAFRKALRWVIGSVRRA